MKITIQIFGPYKRTSIFVDDEQRVLIVDGIKNDKSNIDEFVSKILRIVSSWDSKYENALSLDESGYKIKIENQDKVYTYTAKGDKPSNYNEFTECLRGIEERK